MDGKINLEAQRALCVRCVLADLPPEACSRGALASQEQKQAAVDPAGETDQEGRQEQADTRPMAKSRVPESREE